ncbi:hypothetical protein CSPX01_01521 [Colletotrichum filicis]|nr:hypothetical protein CSPX01_01521 [Colletotrichum filicis]
MGPPTSTLGLERVGWLPRHGGRHRACERITPSNTSNTYYGTSACRVPYVGAFIELPGVEPGDRGPKTNGPLRLACGVQRPSLAQRSPAACLHGPYPLDRNME